MSVMPKLRDVTGETKTKIYFQGTRCRRWVFAVQRTVKLGLTKAGNQAKPQKHSEKKKVVFRTNLEQMFKRTATELNTQPTTQQRLTCVLKNARLLPDDCCSIGIKGNDILFRINISSSPKTIAGLDRRANGLASQVTGPHTNGLRPMGSH